MPFVLERTKMPEATQRRNKVFNIVGFALNATSALGSGFTYFMYRWRRLFSLKDVWNNAASTFRILVAVFEIATVCLLTYSVYTIKKLVGG